MRLFLLIASCAAFANAFTFPNSRFRGSSRLNVVTSAAPIAPVISKGLKGVVEQYFNYWNLREMESAINLFDENCTYEDTLYPGVFQGKDALKAHLFSCADSLPGSFRFCLDVLSEDADGNIGVQWHVENNDKPLPFTRGCSMYKVDPQTLKITSGFDVPEPVAKSGAASLFLLKSVSGFIDEPKKVIPFLAWGFYCWFLFISNVAPGPNALQLDAGTWKEVLDLSFNFWLILPAFFPQFDIDTVSPVLEGIFNLLLAWAGLFAGFMIDGKTVSDGKKVQDDKKEENGFLVPAIIMQFLTNAAYLPYLFTRKLPVLSSSKNPLINEESGVVTLSTIRPKPSFIMEELSSLEKACESKVLPLLFGSVGILSIYWGFFGRVDQGYTDFATRLSSYSSMMSTDRLGFSFVIDLVYFTLFQGWLINDDLSRRGLSNDDVANSGLAKIGTYIPFFGLVYYLLQRPSFPEKQSE